MDHAETGAPVSFPERMPARQGGTTETAWKGLGASLLLHLFVGAAAIAALSGRAEIPPLVIDLTLAEPAGEGPQAVIGPEETGANRTNAPAVAPRSDVPPATVPPAPAPSTQTATEPTNIPLTTAPPESPALFGLSTTHPDRIAAITPVSGPNTGGKRNAPAGAASGYPLRTAPTARATTGESRGEAPAGNPSGKTGAGSPMENFAYIRDAVQRRIAYPATARRMGWEGKVVVAFQLLADGSVRDVRVVEGSGYAALDRGAIDAVRSASPFPRSPVEAEVVTPVIYRLTAR